jgi:hypothetical protein
MSRSLKERQEEDLPILHCDREIKNLQLRVLGTGRGPIGEKDNTSFFKLAPSFCGRCTWIVTHSNALEPLKLLQEPGKIFNRQPMSTERWCKMCKAEIQQQISLPELVVVNVQLLQVSHSLDAKVIKGGELVVSKVKDAHVAELP